MNEEYLEIKHSESFNLHNGSEGIDTHKSKIQIPYEIFSNKKLTTKEKIFSKFKKRKKRFFKKILNYNDIKDLDNLRMLENVIDNKIHFSFSHYSKNLFSIRKKSLFPNKKTLVFYPLPLSMLIWDSISINPFASLKLPKLNIESYSLVTFSNAIADDYYSIKEDNELFTANYRVVFQDGKLEIFFNFKTHNSNYTSSQRHDFIHLLQKLDESVGYTISCEDR